VFGKLLFVRSFVRLFVRLFVCLFYYKNMAKQNDVCLDGLTHSYSLEVVG
jgi:hypothetical protein